MKSINIGDDKNVKGACRKLPSANELLLYASMVTLPDCHSCIPKTKIAITQLDISHLYLCDIINDIRNIM